MSEVFISVLSGYVNLQRIFAPFGCEEIIFRIREQLSVSSSLRQIRIKEQTGPGYFQKIK
jgi:hypothetical protein